MLLRSMVIFGALACAAAASAQTHAVAWRTDIEAAKAEAQQTGRLVLIHFWTERCGPCRLLDKNVFELPTVASAIEANYVPVKVHAAAGETLTQAYGITRVPTDVVVTPQGELVKKFVSPASAMAYVGQAAQVASEYRSRQGQQFANVAAQAPFSQPATQQQLSAAGQSRVPAQQASLPHGAHPGIGQTTQRLAMSNVGAATVSHNPASTAPQVSTPAAVQTQQPNPAIANPYYNQQPAQQAPAQPSTATQAPAVQPQQNTTEDQTTATTPSTPASVHKASAEEQVAKTAKPPVAADLPPGCPPLGFEGYCAVTMKKEWRWAAGDVKWGAIHRGRTYLFSSEASRDEFLKDPDAFSPVLEGADPVLAVEQNASVPGVRDYALEYEGRFYFFAKEETLNKFWTQPAAYAQGAQRVAQSLDQAGTVTR